MQGIHRQLPTARRFFLQPDFLDRTSDIFRQLKRFADFVNYTIDDFE